MKISSPAYLVVKGSSFILPALLEDLGQRYQNAEVRRPGSHISVADLWRTQIPFNSFSTLFIASFSELTSHCRI